MDIALGFESGGVMAEEEMSLSMEDGGCGDAGSASSNTTFFDMLL